MRPPAVVRMTWRNLFFAHWPADVAAVRRLMPAHVPIDTFDGSAWLGVVAFRMVAMRPMGITLPGEAVAFGQLNVRTYTTIGGRPGIWLLSTDVGSRLAAVGSRIGVRVPYHAADLWVTPEPDAAAVRMTGRRRDAPDVDFQAAWRPTGPVAPAEPGSLDAFLTDRLSLYSPAGAGAVLRTEIVHGAWPLQPAEAELDIAPVLEALGLGAPSEPPRLAFSRSLDVLGRLPVRVRLRSVDPRSGHAATG